MLESRPSTIAVLIIGSLFGLGAWLLAGKIFDRVFTTKRSATFAANSASFIEWSPTATAMAATVVVTGIVVSADRPAVKVVDPMCNERTETTPFKYFRANA